MQLRDYQKDLLSRVEDTLDADADARVMMQLPTGGGKTVIAGELLKRRLTRGRRAVWMTHRRELADQTHEMLTKHGVDAEVVRYWRPGTLAPAKSRGVTILMAQTTGNRAKKVNIWDNYDSDDLLVVDEAHHATANSWERPMEQWPGQVMGMTATPWRLSEREGFDHLFSALLRGPQIKELQDRGHLCDVEVKRPQLSSRIYGGRIDKQSGDYQPYDIIRKNGRVMTAGARDFWKEMARGRKTIAYAVSMKHARNLSRVFNRAGIRTGLLLSDTSPRDRSQRINDFKTGNLKVLVNVLVATEGLDLPDASCILVTRPTKSLALYMQMNGRGMRPKEGGNCLILDMAYNSDEHGDPEIDREWWLEARGEQTEGVAPFVHCEECDKESPASSYYCQHCGEPFRDECDRCGKWRAWANWEYRNSCGDEHDPVCDYCHLDAHMLAKLPVDDQLRDELAGLIDEEMDAGEANRRSELLGLIEKRARLLNDEPALDSEFKKYLSGLPKQQRPQNLPQTVDRFVEWKGRLEEELDDWRSEVLQLGKGGSDTSGSLPVGPGWVQVSAASSAKAVRRKPDGLWTPKGEEIEVKNWNRVLVKVVEWLIDDGWLSEKIIDEDEDLDHMLPRTRRGLRRPERLSNGRFLETNVGAERVMRDVEWFIESTGSPERFYVRLSK